jgi:Holliday junction resolvase RusA-like endonuclease
VPLQSYTFTAFIKPKAWTRARVNHKTKRFYTGEQDLHQRQVLQDAFLSQVGPLVAQGALRLPMEGPIRLAVSAFLPLPKATPKKRRLTRKPTGVPDWDNLGKQVCDALQGLAFANDAQVVTALVRKRYAVDEDGQDTPPRWVVTLEQIVESEAELGEATFSGLQHV